MQDETKHRTAILDKEGCRVIAGKETSAGRNQRSNSSGTERCRGTAEGCMSVWKKWRRGDHI